MKALTLWQPWATAIAIGEKAIETRSWRTDYRGPLAIHAAKRPWTDDPAGLRAAFAIEGSLYAAGYDRCDGWDPDVLPLGAVVAVAQLTDCLPIVANPGTWQRDCVALDDEGLARVWRYGQMNLGPGQPQALTVGEETTEHEHELGDFTPGRWGWVLSDVSPIRHVDAQGGRGLWNWARGSAA